MTPDTRCRALNWNLDKLSNRRVGKCRNLVKWPKQMDEYLNERVFQRQLTEPGAPSHLDSSRFVPKQTMCSKINLHISLGSFLCSRCISEKQAGAPMCHVHNPTPHPPRTADAETDFSSAEWLIEDVSLQQCWSILRPACPTRWNSWLDLITPPLRRFCWFAGHWLTQTSRRRQQAGLFLSLARKEGERDSHKLSNRSGGMITHKRLSGCWLMTAEPGVGAEWEERDTLALLSVIYQWSLAWSITWNAENFLCEREIIYTYIFLIQIW